MDYSIDKIAAAIKVKLLEVKEHFTDKKIKVFDIRVSPWEPNIQLSFLLDKEKVNKNKPENWEYFDFSKMSEGKWPEGREIADEIFQEFQDDPDPICYFLDFGSAAALEDVDSVLSELNLAKDFKIRVRDPKDPKSDEFYSGKYGDFDKLDREFYDQLVEDPSSKQCKKQDCERIIVRFSVFCKVHHFEMIKGKTCPFND